MSRSVARGGSRRFSLPPADESGLPVGNVLLGKIVTAVIALVLAVIVFGGIAMAVISVAVGVDGAGFIEPARVWPVRSLEDGIVGTVLVKTGDIVRAGQPLVRLDSPTLASNRTPARADRLREGVRSKLAQQGRLELCAPAGGVVLTDQLERLPGMLVHAGDQVLEVADPSAWRATIIVNEADVHEVTAGDSAMIDVPALKGLNVGRLRGVVTAVALEPGSVPQAAASGRQVGLPSRGTYRVELAIDRTQLESVGMNYLRRGYSATATIVSRRERILVLLRSYLLRRTTHV